MGFIGTFVRRLLHPQRAPALAPGDEAPAFELLDHEGRSVRSADLRGHRVVLWFFPKAATPG